MVGIIGSGYFDVFQNLFWIKACTAIPMNCKSGWERALLKLRNPTLQNESSWYTVIAVEVLRASAQSVPI